MFMWWCELISNITCLAFPSLFFLTYKQNITYARLNLIVQKDLTRSNLTALQIDSDLSCAIEIKKISHHERERILIES